MAAGPDNWHVKFYPCLISDGGCGSVAMYKLADGNMDLPCWDNGPGQKPNCDDGRFNDIDRLEVKSGYVVRVFKGRNDRKSDSTLFEGTVNQLGPFHQQIRGAFVMKDCSKDMHTWDPDCTSENDTDKAHKVCKAKSECVRKRTETCNKKESFIDAKLNPLCIDHCSKNDLEGCAKGIIAYCNDAAAMNAKDKDLCGSKTVIDLIKDSGSCLTDHNLLSTTACQDFCFGTEGKGIPACIEQIKRYCTGAQTGSEYCRKVLTNSAMWGNHNDEMTKFCATADGLSSGLCVCFNTKDIDEVTSKINDANEKVVFKKNPHCFYKPCATNNSTYKQSGSTDTCPVLNVCMENVESTKIMVPMGQEEDYDICDKENASNSSPSRSIAELMAWRAPAKSTPNTMWYAGGGLSSIMCCCAFLVIGMMMMVMITKRR